MDNNIKPVSLMEVERVIVAEVLGDRKVNMERLAEFWEERAAIRAEDGTSKYPYATIWADDCRAEALVASAIIEKVAGA